MSTPTPAWEIVSDLPTSPANLPGQPLLVRRFPVPGGWLYQTTESCTINRTIVDGESKEQMILAWHPPVFVPDKFGEQARSNRRPRRMSKPKKKSRG